MNLAGYSALVISILAGRRAGTGPSAESDKWGGPAGSASTASTA
jgi:hypothetical protein